MSKLMAAAMVLDGVTLGGSGRSGVPIDTGQALRKPWRPNRALTAQIREVSHADL
jgi:hypothetical protein